MLQILPKLRYRLKDFNLGMDFCRDSVHKSKNLGLAALVVWGDACRDAVEALVHLPYHHPLQPLGLFFSSVASSPILPIIQARANRVMLLSVAEPSLAEAADIAAHETRRGETVSTSSHSDEEGRINTRMKSTTPPSRRSIDTDQRCVESTQISISILYLLPQKFT